MADKRLPKALMSASLNDTSKPRLDFLDFPSSAGSAFKSTGQHLFPINQDVDASMREGKRQDQTAEAGLYR